MEDVGNARKHPIRTGKFIDITDFSTHLFLLKPKQELAHRGMTLRQLCVGYTVHKK